MLSPCCPNGSLISRVKEIFCAPVPTGTNAMSCSTTPMALKKRLDMHHRQLWDREDTLNLVVARATQADSALREFLRRVEERRALLPVVYRPHLKPISDVETLNELPAADNYLRQLSYCLLSEAGANPRKAVAIETRHFDLRFERLAEYVDRQLRERIPVAPVKKTFNVMSFAWTMSAMNASQDLFPIARFDAASSYKVTVSRPPIGIKKRWRAGGRDFSRALTLAKMDARGKAPSKPDKTAQIDKTPLQPDKTPAIVTHPPLRELSGRQNVTAIDGAVLMKVVQQSRHRRRGSILACVRESREARGLFPFICMRSDCTAVAFKA